MSFGSKLLGLTFISGFSTTLITLLVIILASKDPKPFSSLGVILTLPAAFVAGLFFCRVVLIEASLQLAKEHKIAT